MKSWSLDELADPHNYQDPINLDGYSKSIILGYLEKMLIIRKAEYLIAEGRKEGLIGGPVHLGVGQEAIAVGVSQYLKDSDAVYGAHRSHSHVLSLGADPGKLFAEVLGRNTGLSRGMGGSMHLWDGEHGFLGSVPIVAGTASLALGSAISAKLNGTQGVGVAYLGDGAVEEGVIHECLNLASIMKAPILFVIENNLFASHMNICSRQPLTATARFASAHDMSFEIVDGNDVVKVARAAEALIENCRKGRGPGFLEAITYRWFGHVDWREDIDVGINRTQKDVDSWKLRCPIKRLKESLILQEVCTEQEIEAMEDRIYEDLKDRWQIALEAPYPSVEAILERVYFTEQKVAGADK